MRILIIIPAFNEGENIKRVVENLQKNYPQYDYVVVNDGSNDDTPFVCRENAYNLIDLPANLGLAGAFQTGMKYAWRKKYDAALQFDGDGQHRPEYIEKMISTMEKGQYDIVIGSRFVEQNKPFTLRMLGSKLISFLILLTTFHHIKDPTSGMRLYGKSVLSEYANNLSYSTEPDTLAYLINRRCKVAEVQVKIDDRIAGTSYLNFINSIHYMIKMCISIVFIQWFRKRK